MFLKELEEYVPCHGLANFFCKGPYNQYFLLVSHMDSVVTPQFYTCSMAAQYVKNGHSCVKKTA